MKKFILGLMAVLCTIVTAFAFTKPEKANKKFTGPYYFQVTNNVNAGIPGSAILAFPTSTPPLSADDAWGCGGTSKICSLGFAGYKLDGGVYKPATMPGGGTIITNYNSRTAEDDKPAQ